MLILICHDTWHVPKSVIPGPLKTSHIVKKKRFSFNYQMANVMILPTRLVRLLDHPQVTMKLVNGSSLDCSSIVVASTYSSLSLRIVGRPL